MILQFFFSLKVRNLVTPINLLEDTYSGCTYTWTNYYIFPCLKSTASWSFDHYHPACHILSQLTVLPHSLPKPSFKSFHLSQLFNSVCDLLEVFLIRVGIFLSVVTFTVVISLFVLSVIVSLTLSCNPSCFSEWL